MKKKYAVYAAVVGTKYLGEVEASSAEEAVDLAYNLDTIHIGLCHRCIRQCEDPTISEITVEEIEG